MCSLADKGQSRPRELKTAQQQMRQHVRNVAGRLGLILGRLGAILGRLGAILGRLGAILGRLGAILGSSWAVLGPSWAVLGPSWAVLEPKMAGRGRHLQQRLDQLAEEPAPSSALGPKT